MNPSPLTIGPANCEVMLGVNWRWLRDHAEELGLTMLKVAGKPFIEAQEALEAIKRHGTPLAHPAPLTDLEAMRARLGKRARGSRAGT